MEQPKRPPNPCVCFLNQKRKELFTQVPAGEKPQAWVAKKGAEMWKALSEEERAPYVAETERLSKIFEAEREKFVAQGGVMSRKRKGDVKDLEVENSSSSTVVHAKEIEQPRMLPHACICFMNEKFVELSRQVPVGERTVAWVAKKAAGMWKALCEAERAPYVEQAELILTAFNEEFEKCDSQGGVVTTAQEGEVKSSTVQSSSSSTAIQPQGMEQPKRPINPCAIFMNERRPEVKKQVPAGEKVVPWVMKKLGEQWTALSDEERAPYVAQYEEKKKAFEEELAKFTAQGGVFIKKRKSEAQDSKRKRRKAPRETLDDCKDPAAEKETEEDCKEEEEVEEEEEETSKAGEEAKETDVEEEMLTAGVESALQEDAPGTPD